MKEKLRPLINDLRLECVLMQAWKKTSSYLRYHSWYSDTLGIDYQSLRIDKFIGEIQSRLKQPQLWCSRPLQIVPAPKSQKWKYEDEKWEPLTKSINSRIRPLAHVDLEDQVVSTAIMLCLANRVESFLGDPRHSISTPENRKQVLSYGHRLFCDNNDNQLFHRWGSSKLYREYFHDYRTFLDRPKVVADMSMQNGYEIAIVQSDLFKFYDCVRPSFLKEKMAYFIERPEEEDFFSLASRVFKWRWTDQQRAMQYGKNNCIKDFVNIALPQGLVAAGFFANIVMCDFDRALRGMLGQTLPNSNYVLLDACYYVDDFRFVLRVQNGSSEEAIKTYMVKWLQGLLDVHAKELVVSEDKTEVTIEGRERRFLIKQSSEANRIQKQVSGVFDLQLGTQLISAIEGFFQTQHRYSVNNNPDGGLLIGVPDMGDDTATRFAAGKFRRTFRSLRPLLSNGVLVDSTLGISDTETNDNLLPQLFLTKKQLDERAKLFSAMLIEEWIKNPGNVRLLRIALDIYPDTAFLKQVLSLLRPGWNSSKFKSARREVRLYCLAELFRAGATETGFVQEDECLPSNISLQEYHALLIKEARNILDKYLDGHLNPHRFPWYLMQQVFLYLSARNALPDMCAYKARGGKMLSHYWILAKFVSGKMPQGIDQRAIYSAIVTTAFGFSHIDSINNRISPKYLSTIEKISPKLAANLWSKLKRKEGPILACAKRLGLEAEVCTGDNIGTLPQMCRREDNPFLDEVNVLVLTKWLLENIESYTETLTPWNISCEVKREKGYQFGRVIPNRFSYVSADKATHLFEPSDWFETDEEKQKYQVGVIVRYVIRGSTNFYDSYRLNSKGHEYRYTKPVTNWEQQKYSGYQGREAFGPAWLPISSSTEEVLFELLRWPGSSQLTPPLSKQQLLNKVSNLLRDIKDDRGDFSSVLFLKQKVQRPEKGKGSSEEHFKIGIVQSVIPKPEDFNENVMLQNQADFRLRHRLHLAEIMKGVTQMLRIRNTHSPSAAKHNLDLLIFPELAVHPNDIKHYILPFVRQYKCVVLFGQVYHPKYPNTSTPLINSCLWVVPQSDSSTKGLKIRYIEQGKRHLAKPEKELNGVVGFRPAQWLLQYFWSQEAKPLTLSASVCYDATDLALVADLRDKSDLYIICALNKDVNTFDQMSETLYYHMYQAVIIVNNGEYGGSSLHVPRKESVERHIFHLHGQSQASIAFAELDPNELLRDPKPELKEWKTPPAGFTKK